MLAQRELNKIKKQLESAENTKIKALSELDKANVTLLELTKKLNNVRESKQSAIEESEVVRNQAKELEKALSQKAIGYEAWKQELEHARKEYTTTVKELDASKQELNKIRQDFDAALEAKLAAFQAAGEAQRSAKLNSEKINELSKEIATMKASTEQFKLATAQAQEEQIKAVGEKEEKLNSYKASKEEIEKKLMEIRNEYDAEDTQSLEAKLVEASDEIQVLQEKMKEFHDSEMDSVELITLEIKEATKTLQEISEEETLLRNIVDSLKTELEQVKKEQDELREKEKASEALAANLTGSLQSSKEEEDSFESKESNERHCRETEMKIKQLSFETENARKEEEEMRIKTQELSQEIAKSKALSEEIERKLELLLKQAEEAKAEEKRAVAEMKLLSDSQGRVSVSDTSGKIILTVAEFAALSGKIKESEDLIERTETTAMAQVEAINTRRNEVEKKVEANRKAIEEIKAATDLALRNAEMADSAKLAVEGELKRKRNEEQKGISDSDHSSRPISLQS